MTEHTIELGSRKPSQAIISGIGAVTDTPVEELPPLYSTIDLDALNTLLQNSKDGVYAEFEYEGLEITATPEAVTITSQTTTGSLEPEMGIEV